MFLTTQAVHVKRNIEPRSCDHCCTGKSISIIQPVCAFVALGIQHAMRMHRIVICDLSGSALFSMLFHKGTILEEKSYCGENVCFDFLCNFLSEIFLILRTTERDMIETVDWLFVSDFN